MTDERDAATAQILYQQRLPIWTIYRPTTSNHPGLWVARMFFTLPEVEGTQIILFGDTLEQVRMKLPPGLTHLARSDDDDPVVEEVWL